MTQSENYVRKLAMAAWLVPASCVFLCVSYVLRARASLGVWPEYDNPDPKALGWPIHHGLILLSLLAIYPSLIFSAGASCFLFFRRRFRSASLILLTTVAVWLALLALANTSRADDFFGWYLD